MLQIKIKKGHDTHERHFRALPGGLEFRWTPRHKGIPGNVLADEEAKEVADGDLSLNGQFPKSCRAMPPLSKEAA